MQDFNLYEDIKNRTGGDVYIGVVGPVRSGKSTFITKFMEAMVLPNISNESKRQRAIDELPQAADGKTIMTTEPKFVPSDAVTVEYGEGVTVNVRLVDCVGYLVDGAIGHTENDKPRYVYTPWSKDELPFAKAAEIGTERVIKEHSTIGILMTTDGSITGIPRSGYVEAEERVVSELKALGKPFTVVLNSARTDDPETVKLRESLSEKYGVTVLLEDVSKCDTAMAERVLSSVLFEFPIKAVECNLPKWMKALDATDEVLKTFIAELTAATAPLRKMGSAAELTKMLDSCSLGAPVGLTLDMGTGKVTVTMGEQDKLFYDVLTAATGIDITDNYNLLSYVKNLSEAGRNYARLKDALDAADEFGYGIVPPTAEQMKLEEPEIVRQGSRVGVKLRASAPSLHVMRVDVQTEINPLVGSEQQGEELVQYLLSDYMNDKESLWNTNMFGKPLSSLVKEGLAGKLNVIPAPVQAKMRKTMSRIVNEGRGGVLCILL